MQPLDVQSVSRIIAAVVLICVLPQLLSRLLPLCIPCLDRERLGSLVPDISWRTRYCRGAKCWGLTKRHALADGILGLFNEGALEYLTIYTHSQLRALVQANSQNTIDVLFHDWVKDMTCALFPLMFLMLYVSWLKKVVQNFKLNCEGSLLLTLAPRFRSHCNAWV